MSIVDVKDFLESLGITVPVYPLAFPSSSPVEAVMVEVGQGISSRGSVMEVTLTLTVRAEHPMRGEAISLEFINKLDNLTNQTVGNYDFILIKSQQLLPGYLGKSPEGAYYYMNNFKVLASS